MLVPTNGVPQPLVRVPLTGPESKAAYSEDWLQKLLYAHPGALPVQDIDTSFTDLVPVCREMPVPGGYVDVAYVTRDGRPVIVEAKLWRNPEARRKVIGQILDYAKELATWDVADFDAAIKQARADDGENPPRGLVDLLGIGADSPEAARFHDSLTQNLQRGKLLLLIVGDGIREGVGAITNFLEGHGTLHFTFGLIEIAVFRTPDGGHLVQPRLLVQSDIVKRIVVNVKTGEVDFDAALDAEENENQPGNERAMALNTFWTAFMKDLRLDRSDQPVKAPANGGNQFFAMPTGNGWVSAFMARSEDRAGVYLALKKGAIGDRIYDALLRDRKAIDQELGGPTMWESEGERYYIVTSARFPGPILEVSGDAARKQLADWTNRYINTFRPRLETLVREIG